MANSVFTAQQVIDAIKEADGYVSKIASLLNCSVQTVYNYRDKYKSVADAWRDVKERRHDFVENALHKRIKAGSDTAIIFYLKTQAKDRGYVERQEVVVNWQQLAKQQGISQEEAERIFAADVDAMTGVLMENDATA